MPKMTFTNRNSALMASVVVTIILALASVHLLREKRSVYVAESHFVDIDKQHLNENDSYMRIHTMHSKLIALSFASWAALVMSAYVSVYLFRTSKNSVIP